MTALPIGKGEIRREGKSIALLSFGSMLETGMKVGHKINATVANMRFVKPLDEELIVSLVKSHDLLLTLEDNVVLGGAGSAVNEIILANNLDTHIINMGLPDTFQEHGSRSELLADAGLTTDDIMARIEEFRQQPLAKHVTLA